MPHSTIVDLLIQKRTLSKKEWISIIEARKVRLVNHIKELGQTKLADVEHWLNPGSFYGKVGGVRIPVPMGSASRVLTVDESGTISRLYERGVFIFSPESYSGPKPNEDGSIYVDEIEGPRKMIVYGFARHEDWIVVEIEFRLIGDGHIETDKRVHVQDVSLKTLLDQKGRGGYGLKPSDVFFALSRVAGRHLEKRRDLLLRAEELVRSIDAEDSLVEHYLPD